MNCGVTIPTGTSMVSFWRCVNAFLWLFPRGRRTSGVHQSKNTQKKNMPRDAFAKRRMSFQTKTGVSKISYSKKKSFRQSHPSISSKLCAKRQKRHSWPSLVSWCRKGGQSWWKVLKLCPQIKVENVSPGSAKILFTFHHYLSVCHPGCNRLLTFCTHVWPWKAPAGGLLTPWSWLVAMYFRSTDSSWNGQSWGKKTLNWGH